MAIQTIPSLKKVDSLDARFVQETPIKDSKKVMRLDPIPLLDPNDYSMNGTKNHFLPDARASVPQGANAGIVEGFGLRWFTSLPPKEGTINHCQKILQVDREIGLLDFVNKQRSSFRIDDGMKGIGKAREILNKPFGKLPAAVGGVAGAVMGIFAVFDTLKNAVAPPEKPIQKQPIQNPA